MAISEKAIKAIEANTTAKCSLHRFSDVQKEYRYSKPFVVDVLKYHIETYKKDGVKPKVYEIDEFYKKLIKKYREDKDIISLVADLCELADIDYWDIPEALELELESRKIGLPIKKKTDSLQSVVKDVISDINILPTLNNEHVKNKDFWYSVIEQCDEDDLEDFSAVVPQEFYEDKEFLFKVASIRGEALKYIWEPSIYIANKNLIIQAISSYPEIYEEISPTLKNDIDIIVALVKNDEDNLDLVDKTILLDETVIYNLVDVTEGHILSYLDTEELTKKEIFISAIDYDARYLEYASDILTSDEKFMRELIKIDGEAYKYASENIRKKRDILLIALKTSGYAIEDYPLDYQNDDEIIKLALADGVFAYDTPDFILNNKEYAEWLIEKSPWCIEKLPKTFVNENMILHAISSWGKTRSGRTLMNERRIVGSIPEELLDDKDFVMKAIENGLPLRCVSNRLSNDEEVVSLAVNKDIDNIKSISDELRANISFMLKFFDLTDGVFGHIRWWDIDSMTEKEKSDIIDIIKVNPHLVGLIYGHTPHYSEFLYEAVQADPLVIGSFSYVIPKYSPFIEEPCEYLLKVLNKEFKMTEKQLLKLTDTKIIL